MPESPELLDLVTRAASWGGNDEQVEVFASRVRSTSIRVYDGKVERFTAAEPFGVGIRVIVDGKEGFASAGSLDETVLKETLEEARDNAAFAQPDEFNGLAEPDGEKRPTLQLHFDDLAALSADDKIARILDAERLTKARDPRLRVHSASWSDSIGEQAIASSTGISSWFEASRGTMTVYALADEDGQTQTGFGFNMGRQAADLDPEAVAEEAANNALRMIGARKPRSAKLTALLIPEVTDSFLGIIGSTLSGEAVLKGRSLFAERVGEDVASPLFTLVDDPTDPAAPGAWPDDDEGLVSRRNLLIEGGVLKGFLQNTHSGRRSGAGSTGSAVRGYASTPMVACRALTVQPGTKSHDELIAEVGDGVLIQGVSGLHSGVNPVSGDFSVGASGLMIRDGALAEPVQEMTIASTLQRMLKDVVAVGNDLRWQGDAAGVTLVIRDIALAGA